jgi:hypothetical protein
LCKVLQNFYKILIYHKSYPCTFLFRSSDADGSYSMEQNKYGIILLKTKS